MSGAMVEAEASLPADLESLLVDLGDPVTGSLVELVV